MRGKGQSKKLERLLRLKFKYEGADYPQTYFHYMLGYLLPGYLEISSRTKSVGSEKVNYYLRIDSFGEVMDEKFSEVLDSMGLTHEFVSENTPINSNSELIYPDRWDNTLFNIQFFKTANWFLKIKLIGKSLFNPRFLFNNLLSRKSFHRKLDTVRKELMSLLGNTENPITSDRSSLVFLERVTSNKKYDQQKLIGGGYSYGKERRTLIGIDDAINKIKQGGLEFSKYTPGSRSLEDQITQFSTFDKVIAIRGAELANTLWMKPQSTLIVIDNFKGTGINTNPAKIIAQFLNIKFHQIKVSPDSMPVLEGDLLEKVQNLVLNE